MSATNPESAVLGACLLDPAAYWRCADLLTADDFAQGGHRRLWGVIADLHREGGAVDSLTVSERDPALSQLAFDLGSGAFSAANARTYAGIVAQRAIERRVIAAGQRIASLRGDDALAEAQRILAACAPRNVAAVRHAREVLGESVKALTARYETGERMTGLGTSLPGLDALTSGWQRSDLIVVGARPSVGKTALGLQCALHAASAGAPVLMFSAEMAGRQIMDRAIAHVSGVPLSAIRCPHDIEAEGWPKITRASETLSAMPLWIDDSAGLTVEAIAARARQLDAEKRLGLVVIDYLQHLTPPRAEKTVDAVQLMTRALKAMAKALDVPVLLLSQLNREGEDRPTLRALRDSGAIEQDADVIAFLHRPRADKRDEIQLILAKQRNGETGDLWLHADMPHMRFIETDEPQHEPEQRRSGFRARGFGSARDRAAGG